MCDTFGICDKDTLSPVGPGNAVCTRVEIIGGLRDVLDCSHKFWVHGATIFDREGKDLDVVGYRDRVPVIVF